MRKEEIIDYGTVLSIRFLDNAGPTPPRCGELVPTKASPSAATDDRDGDPSARKLP